MGFISSGQARSLDSGAPGTEQVRVSDIRRFTISSVVFQWVTKPSPTDSKHSPTRYVPMARLAGSVELRSGRKIGMSVMSPATIDLPVRSRRTDGEVPAFNE